MLVLPLSTPVKLFYFVALCFWYIQDGSAHEVAKYIQDGGADEGGAWHI